MDHRSDRLLQKGVVMRSLAGLMSRRRIVIGGAVATLLILILVVVVLLISANTSSADDQPIAFSHRAHSQAGVQCQFCHTGVSKSPSAGIPSVELCMGCHL